MEVAGIQGMDSSSLDLLAVSDTVAYNSSMRLCDIENCHNVHKGRGYCMKHLGRLWRHGDVNKVLPTYKKHGMRAHPLYGTWKSMRVRCNNPNSTGYKWWGARGIKVCDRWNNFELFVKDVGEKPSPKHQLDRIDNNGNYEPGNVRWATRAEQVFNQRRSSATGVKGVYYYKKLNKYTARACKIHKLKHLGVHLTIDEAKKAIENYGCDYDCWKQVY